MSIEPVRRANLAAITCEPRPHLPDGFRRHSVRVGAALGAARTGLSVYEVPPGQAVGPYHYEDPQEEWLLVVSGTPPCGIRAARNGSSRGTSPSFPPAPPERTRCGTRPVRPPASRCSPPSRRWTPSSIRTAT